MFSSYGKQVKIQILREDEYDINIISKFNIVLPDGSLFDI